MADLDTVHQVIVADLQEVHTKLSQEDSNIYVWKPIVAALQGLAVLLRHTSHCFARVMTVVFELNGQQILFLRHVIDS